MNSESEARAREARPTDAGAISALYRRAYSGVRGRSAANNYPFPQVLDSKWVHRAIASEEVSWLVGEVGADVRGCVAATLRAGPPGSRVAEFFGLVTDQGSRHRGLANFLLAKNCERIGAEFDVAVGQMRTADPHVARTVKKTPLRPLGFEPFVHDMFGVPESMVVVGGVSVGALRARAGSGSASALVRALAERVLEAWESEPLEAPWTHPARARADGEAGMRFVQMRWLEARSRGGGSRQRPLSYVSRAHGSAIGVVHLAEDRHDRRLKIAALCAGQSGREGETLSCLLDSLREEACGELRLVVGDVFADDGSSQRILESAGFRPVAYYPALLPKGSERLDVVRYTWTTGLAVRKALESIATVDWPDAQRIARHVVQSFEV